MKTIVNIDLYAKYTSKDLDLYITSKWFKFNLFIDVHIVKRM